MKKIATAVVVATLLLSAVNAYNPPVGAEDMCLLSSPRGLSGAVSVTGGALFSAGADSVTVNPALTASEQRVNLNAGYTALVSSKEYNEGSFGSGLQVGIMIPNKMFVFSGYMNGVFAPFLEMHLENSLNAKAGLAKEITDKLSVGAGLYGGYTWGFGSDWALGAELGFLYKYGDLGFIKDFRYGASVLNLGKNFQDVKRLGLDKTTTISEFPAFATVKAGAAGTFLSTDVVKLGGAFDVTVPTFQNIIFDLNVQACIKEMLTISIGDKINLAETIKGHGSFIPSVSLTYKFDFNVNNNQFLESNDWSQSEMTVSGGYKNLYSTVHAISAGVDVNLGMKDTTGPQIILWDDEE